VRRVHLPGSPYGIAIDRRRERLWVTLTATNQLVELSANGRPRRIRYLPTIRQPNSIAVDEATGTIYLTSRTDGTLQIVDPDAGRAGGDGGDSASLLANPPPETGLRGSRRRPVRGPASSRARSRAQRRAAPSRALGVPTAGRLVNGIRLPADGPHHFTWDPVKKRSPNRPWRRHGTDRLVRTVVRVLRDHRRAHPHAPRIGVGDLSRPTGGDFGRRFGPLGHASHQNGLDADVYYPRRDRRERAPRHPGQVDRRLAQDLVDRFVRAGAQYVFVGPRVPLHGRPGVVQVAPHHDDHLHVRLPARP
jgi:hypothetical protein